MQLTRQFLICVFLLTFFSTAMAAPAGVNWQWDNPRPQANVLTSIAMDESSGNIITVGALGTIVTSSNNGSSWTVQASGTRERLNSAFIAPAAGIAYVVGNRGTILSSPSNDFTTWTANDSGTFQELNEIAWNENLVNSLFVVVGEGGTVLTNDGTSTTWVAQTSQTVSDAGRLRGITWSPDLSMFVAVSLSGRVITSADGSNWTLQAYTAPSGFQDVYWDSSASQFIATGNAGLIATSPDAVNWTQRTTSTGSGLQDVTRLGGDLFVAGSTLVLLKSSNNGVDWTPVFTNVTVRSVISGSNSLLMAGRDGIVERSTDAGVTWTRLLPSTSLTGSILTDITWNGTNQFVISSFHATQSLSSADGITWTVNTSPSTPRWHIWDGTRYVGAYRDGVYISNDGMSWSRQTIIPTNGGTASTVINDIAWSGSQYIIVGAAGYVITSPDAAFDNWTVQTPPTAEVFNAVSADGPLLVAVGGNATLMTSSDAGVSWSSPASLPDIGSNTLFAVTWSGTQYVAVGQLGTTLTSSDGITWVERTGFTSINLESIYWNGELYITTGSAGVIFTSSDAISWTQQDSVTTTDLKAIAGDSNRLVAVGRGGNIVSSVNNSFTVGGTVTGLSDSLVLQNNGGDNLLISSDGNFTFAGALTTGENYNVTILAQPAGQICSVSGATGTVGTADVTNVSVTCADIPTFAIGGNVSGLNGALVLQNNAGDNLVVNASGSFTFATRLIDGSSYNVTVAQSPSTQNCSVTGATGTVASSDVTTVTVTCVDLPTFSIGGNVAGLNGTLVLQNNAGDNLVVNASGSFTFATRLIDGSSYNITVVQSPSSQNCSVTGATGTVASADVTTVAVVCVDLPTFSIGGNVTGLDGTLVLQNNGGDKLTLTTDGNFAFAAELLGAASYEVTIMTQPSGQTCNLSNSAGVVNNADVTVITITCTVNETPNAASGGGGAINMYWLILLTGLLVLRRTASSAA